MRLLFTQVEEEQPAVVETDDDVRRAMARLDRYTVNRPADRRRPSSGRDQKLGSVISLWPR
jgi:hypothetical protein